jgi:rhodanese-related sulfurtransferase
VRTRDFAKIHALAILALASFFGAASFASSPKAKTSVFEATLEQQGQNTPELSTEEFREFLTNRSGVVLDARPKQEFAVAHIPSSVSIDEKGLLRIVQALPDRATEIVVYSNGPFCDWAKRRAEELLGMGYTRVSRYQLGLAVWRALGNTAETSLEGFRRIFHGNTAVLVDARSRADYLAGTMPTAETVQTGEVNKAMQDHRLQYYDHATRIVVFGYGARDARAVAEEISRNDYPNSSYFGGTYQELKQAKFFSERKPTPMNVDGLKR